MDEDGVSPVIGVILMVAIGVAMAGLVWVMILLLTSDEGEETGRLVGTQDERQDRWVLARGANVPQDNFAFYGSETGVRYAWNETADSSSPLLPTTRVEMGGVDAWGSGAYISLCADGPTPAIDYELTFVDIKNEVIVSQSLFTLVKVCA